MIDNSLVNDEANDYMIDDKSLITIGDQSIVTDNNQIVAITTIDNPYDPIDDFDNWFMFDTSKGYYTSNKIARLTVEFEGMTSIEEKAAIEMAIDRLIEIDPLGIYIKVTKKIDKDKEMKEQLQYIEAEKKKDEKSDVFSDEFINKLVNDKGKGTMRVKL